ncbi:hypothetical protein L0128_09645 [candidate division KSB1 bacterium]|nr:hypothetical protein [candidate division KSB1 bacterium]
MDDRFPERGDLRDNFKRADFYTNFVTFNLSPRPGTNVASHQGQREIILIVLWITAADEQKLVYWTLTGIQHYASQSGVPESNASHILLKINLKPEYFSLSGMEFAFIDRSKLFRGEIRMQRFFLSIYEQL